MLELTQIQKIVGLGRLQRLVNVPISKKIDNAQISWETAAICCQVFKDNATAPVIATCLFHSLVDDSETMEAVLGYNPVNALTELEKAIVRYCVILAELHELDCEVKAGNFFVQPALLQTQETMDKVNNLIADLSDKAKAKSKTPSKPKKKYNH